MLLFRQPAALLISSPFVKPYFKGNKNDANDAMRDGFGQILSYRQTRAAE
ncbi:MAG: hypothetical protein ACXV8Q_14005 [Methylobacter sp.]